MPDEIDRAQAQEAQYRAACLANASAPRPDAPQERDAEGRVICADCGEPIPAARLAALPGIGLCVGCQQKVEGGSRG